MNIKKALKDFCPPIILRALARPSRYGFFGNYPSWEAARAASSGYDSATILAKVRDAALKVKRGEAAFERDSVTFNHIEYSWPVLAGLLWAAGQSNGALSVLDFGGSLGSSYLQNRAFLTSLASVRWSVVEQDAFAAEGRAHFKDEHLKFYRADELEQCVVERGANVLLASSVIQYLERPYEMLNRIIGLGLPYLIFDRTAFIVGSRDRLSVQKVRPSIYDASYPAWFLGEEKFLKAFAGKYDVVAAFDALGGTKGFIFKKHA